MRAASVPCACEWAATIGTGNIVGMAVAAKMAAAHFNTPEHKIFDHLVVGLAGDGCLQEGISQEAASFAGRFGLDNLIMLYDSNDVTLDAMASKTQNEDTAKRYEAANWEVFTVRQGNELAPLAAAVDVSRVLPIDVGSDASSAQLRCADGRPVLLAWAPA